MIPRQAGVGFSFAASPALVLQASSLPRDAVFCGFFVLQLEMKGKRNKVMVTRDNPA